MSNAEPFASPGILVDAGRGSRSRQAREAIVALVASLQLDDVVRIVAADDGAVALSVEPAFFARHLAGHDTTRLSSMLGLDPARIEDLRREALIAMACCPQPFVYPDADELASAIRARAEIADCGRRTSLAFDTEEAERPADYWTYDEARGFTLLPGAPLIEAIELATQPEKSGRLYSFSCSRATEHVVLLGIARELRHGDPALLAQLQRQWETRAIRGYEFSEVILREHGSPESPLPIPYFVPGDRVWFRNTDPPSSDIAGYEGSWVVYTGSGEFSNFWKPNQPYTLQSKCVEIYHWRHATWRDSTGQWRLDESVVDERVERTLAQPDEVARILPLMLRTYEAPDVHAPGGCIDPTLEHPQLLRAGTSTIRLPDV